MLKITRSSNKPAFKKNNSDKLVFKKNNSNGKIIKFDINGNGKKFAKKLKNQKIKICLSSKNYQKIKIYLKIILLRDLVF